MQQRTGTWLSSGLGLAVEDEPTNFHVVEMFARYTPSMPKKNLTSLYTVMSSENLNTTIFAYPSRLWRVRSTAVPGLAQGLTTLTGHPAGAGVAI